VVEVGLLGRLALLAAPDSLAVIALSSRKAPQLDRFGSNLGTVDQLLQTRRRISRQLQVLRGNASAETGEARFGALGYQELYAHEEKILQFLVGQEDVL
jgi:hypothetical protein